MKGVTMTITEIENSLEILETYETTWCEIHKNFISLAECVECEMSTCADCLRAYGCDNCY